MTAIFAFYVGKGRFADRIIRTISRHPTSHVEILLDDQLRPKNRVIGASKRDDDQVRAKWIEWKPENWVFIKVPGIDADLIQARAISQLGENYDEIGAILSVTRFARQGDGWFCSSLAGWLYGLHEWFKQTPGDIALDLLDRGGVVIQIPE